MAVSIRHLLTWNSVSVWKYVLSHLCLWDMRALRATCRAMRVVLEKLIEDDPGIVRRTRGVTLSVTAHLIHLALYARDVEWEESLDSRDLAGDAPLFVDAQLSMFESLDLQFSDGDGSALAPIGTQIQPASPAPRWNLMHSNGCNRQAACQVLSATYRLNRGKIIAAALRTMEKGLIESMGSRLFRAGAVLLEEFHSLLSGALLSGFVQAMKTGMCHLLYSMWECIGRREAGPEDPDPQLTIAELIEVILREEHRQKSTRDSTSVSASSSSSAEAVDQRVQQLRTESAGGGAQGCHDEHFSSAPPLFTQCAARNCRICSYVQSTHAKLLNRLHGDRELEKLEMRKSELERAAWARRRLLASIRFDEEKLQRLSAKLGVFAALKVPSNIVTILNQRAAPISIDWDSPIKGVQDRRSSISGGGGGGGTELDMLPDTDPESPALGKAPGTALDDNADGDDDNDDDKDLVEDRDSNGHRLLQPKARDRSGGSAAPRPSRSSSLQAHHGPSNALQQHAANAAAGTAPLDPDPGPGPGPDPDPDSDPDPDPDPDPGPDPAGGQDPGSREAEQLKRPRDEVKQERDYIARDPMENPVPRPMPFGSWHHHYHPLPPHHHYRGGDRMSAEELSGPSYKRIAPGGGRFGRPSHCTGLAGATCTKKSGFFCRYYLCEECCIKNQKEQGIYCEDRSHFITPMDRKVFKRKREKPKPRLDSFACPKCGLTVGGEMEGKECEDCGVPFTRCS